MWMEGHPPASELLALMDLGTLKLWWGAEMQLAGLHIRRAGWYSFEANAWETDPALTGPHCGQNGDVLSRSDKHVAHAIWLEIDDQQREVVMDAFIAARARLAERRRDWATDSVRQYRERRA